MTFNKEKLKGLLWAETASWSADCSGWKLASEALDEFLGEKTIEEVALALLEENEVLRRECEGKVLCELELFETLRDSANTEADEHRQCMANYRPLRQANLDSVVKKCDDLLAAMSKGEQS